MAKKIVENKNLKSLSACSHNTEKLWDSVPQNVVDTKNVHGLKKVITWGNGWKENIYQGLQKTKQDASSGLANESWREKARKLCYGGSGTYLSYCGLFPKSLLLLEKEKYPFWRGHLVSSSYSQSYFNFLKKAMVKK